jgi:DNA-binding transcriptional ArsR family regulator
MTAIFEALSDPTRQRIMALLLDGERPVGDLVDALGVAQPSVSKHLARLKAVGLVDLRADAQRRLYRLTPEPLRDVDVWLQPYLKAPKVDETVELSLCESRQKGWTIVLEAPTAAPADALWAALTEPEKLGAWLGRTSVEPHETGRFKPQFMGSGLVVSGRINIWSPLRKLGYRWRIGSAPENPAVNLLFELAYGSQGACLIVTLDRVPQDTVAEFAALWHAHLERLGPALRGEVEPWDPARLDARLAQYEALTSQD